MKKAWTLQDDDCGDARMDIAVVVEETEEDALEALRKELQDGDEYWTFVVIDDSIYQFIQGYGYKGEKWDRKDLRPEMWDIGASCGRYNLIEVLCCYRGETYDDVEEFFKHHDLIKTKRESSSFVCSEAFSLFILSVIFLVMEQSDSCKCHHHSIFVAGFDHCIISHRATRLCDKFHTALMCSFNVITEREECV